MSAPSKSDTLWTRDAPAVRGIAPEDIVGQIASVAMTIADREGLAGLSVKRVGSKLGAGSVKLESYLTSKDDLLDLIFDAFYGEIDAQAAATESADWRAGLRAIAAATKAALGRHPWALELMGTRPPFGPNGLRSSERALSVVDGIGLDSFAMTSAVNTVLAYVCGSIRRELRGSGGSVSGDESSASATAEYLQAVVASGDYPLLARIISDGENMTEASSYDAGLDQVLDGIGVRVG
jgi:AcrR family transcriptional regulator